MQVDEDVKENETLVLPRIFMHIFDQYQSCVKPFSLTFQQILSMLALIVVISLKRTRLQVRSILGTTIHVFVWRESVRHAINKINMLKDEGKNLVNEIRFHSFCTIYTTLPQYNDGSAVFMSHNILLTVQPRSQGPLSSSLEDPGNKVAYSNCHSRPHSPFRSS